MRLSLKEIAALCNGRIEGDTSKTISGVNLIERATQDDLVFIADSRHARLLEASNAGAIICSADQPVDSSRNLVIVENPLLAFATVAEKLHPADAGDAGVSETATIDPTSRIPASCFVGDHVSIGKNVRLGENVSIASGSQVESDCQIGDDTIIHQNVVIKRGTTIGRGSRIHPGVVLGADGFGLAKQGESWFRIPQLGRLVIGDEVDIGANTTVDRGSLGNTEIGNGVKMDNLIQVGHNVRIGANTVIAAHTAIAGSTVIGHNCEIGGCVGIMDHSEITHHVKIGGGSVVSGRITEPGVYSSSIKADKLDDWQKNVAWLRKLNTVIERIKKLEKE